MPIHRVPRASLHEDIVRIVREGGERFIAFTSDANDPECYLVLTDYDAEVTELRGAAL